jgi:hypothetical protein
MTSMEWIAFAIGVGIMVTIGVWAMAIGRPFHRDKP